MRLVELEPGVARRRDLGEPSISRGAEMTGRRRNTA